jgi:NPCBM/NEW2 domain
MGHEELLSTKGTKEHEGISRHDLRVPSCPFVDPIRLIYLLISFLVAVSPAAAQDSWTLVTGDFQSRSVTLVAMDEHGVKIAAEGPEPQTVDWGQVLELDHDLSPATAKPDGLSLRLNGGDSIAGNPVSIADDAVVWNHPLLGRLTIPEDRVDAIVRGKTAAGLDEARKEDTARLVNGDQVSGVVQSLDDSTLAIQPAGADSPAQIGLDKITAILLADSDPLLPPAGRAWRVSLSDGSTLTVPVATAENGRLTVGFDSTHLASIDLANVARIEQIDGPVRWLTSLSPSEVVYHPFLEENFPPRFDHPVDDPTASIAERFPPFRHGIGVHSYTKLTYAVPDGYKTFRTQFAVEAISGSDMTKADLTVRILLDGKVARQFLHVRAGPATGPVTLDVGGARELSLEVDFGDSLGAQGRFVWLDPAFVKEVTPSP